MGKKLVAEVIRVLEEEYINPFHILVDEECLFNLSSRIPVNNLLVEKVLPTKEFSKKLAVAFTTARIRKIQQRSFKKHCQKKVTFIQKFCKVCNCTKE